MHDRIPYPTPNARHLILINFVICFLHDDDDDDGFTGNASSGSYW